MKKNEKGFALPLSIMLLVVMTLMGATLISMVSSDIKSNESRDTSSQAFYAAESGISMAKQYLKTATQYNLGNNPNVKFCKTDYFPILKKGTVKTINNHVERRNLNEVISASGQELKRIQKFSYEYFITNSPDKDGNTSSKQKFGTKLDHYTIFACGCDDTKTNCRSQNNTIVTLEAVVTIIE